MKLFLSEKYNVAIDGDSVNLIVSAANLASWCRGLSALDLGESQSLVFMTGRDTFKVSMSISPGRASWRVHPAQTPILEISLSRDELQSVRALFDAELAGHAPVDHADLNATTGGYVTFIIEGYWERNRAKPAR